MTPIDQLPASGSAPATRRSGRRGFRLRVSGIVLALVAGVLAIPATQGTDSSEALSSPVRIMFVGDSITSGRSDATGGDANERPTFRAALYGKLDLAGFDFDFVGSESGIDNAPNTIQDPRLIDPDHEGHSGWRLDELINGRASAPQEGNLTGWMNEQNPDVVVLYAGANDFNTNIGGEEQNQLFDEMHQAIAAMRAVNPNVRIVITNLHPRGFDPVGNPMKEAIKPFVPELQRLSTPQSPVVAVDIHSGFPTSALDSGSHPGPAGQEFIAEQIFRAMVNSGILLDNTPAPSLDDPGASANRGARNVEVTLTGDNLFAGYDVNFGSGVTVTSKQWSNNIASNSSVTVTLDIALWTTPGTRNITFTNIDGDSVVCSACFTVNSAQTQPPLRIMLLGGETSAGRRYVPNEAPTYRQDLHDLLEGAGVQFDFVGSQRGVDSGSNQAMPAAVLEDPDHEGHAFFSVDELIGGKFGEESQGDLQDWLDAANPDVVVVMAGQADVRADQAPNGIINELKILVDRLRAHNPNVRIVLTNVNLHRNSGTLNAKFTAYNNFFNANAGTSFTSTQQSPLATADIGGLNIGAGGDINDSTYPNASGNAKIAAAVFNALSSNGMLDPVPQAPGPVPSASANEGLGEVTFSWSAPPQSGFELTPITGYRVTLSPGNVTRNLGANETSTTFIGLNSQVDYTLTIVPRNAVGDGPAFQVSGSPDGSFNTNGYWMIQATGTVHAFGGGAHHGDPTGQMNGANAVAIAGHPQGGGYWVLASDGTVYAFGSAQVFAASSTIILQPGEFFTAIAAAPDGNGYWIFTSAGRAINHGSAQHFGDLITLGITPNGDVVASAPTASGLGYFMIGSEGGVFAFGDAGFQGSIQSVIGDLGLDTPAALWLAAPIVGIVPTPSGTGYWMIASDGGVFGFNAPFRGSVPGALNGGSPAFPVNGMVPFGTDGYIAVAFDGGIFAFGDAQFFGSLPERLVATDVVGVAPSFGLVS